MFSRSVAYLYWPTFYVGMLLLTLCVCLYLDRKTWRDLQREPTPAWWMVALLVVFIVLVGLRPISGYAFGDTSTYANSFKQMQRQHNFHFNENGDWLFDRMMFRCSHLMPVSTFFLIIETLYIVPMAWACRRLLPRQWPLLMMFCLGAFSFFSYGVNGIRNGMACSLVLLALTFVRGNVWEKLFCALLCVLAYNFHHSTALPIGAMLAAYFLPRPKFWIGFWFAAIGLSLVAGEAVTQFFAGLGFDERFSSYTSDRSKTTMEQFSSVGFRWDFLLYSFMPVLLGYYAILKRGLSNKTYTLLLCTYLIANAFWIMVIRSAFSNRFAYLSWFLYPVVLGYPVLKLRVWKTDFGRKTGLVLLGQEAFTFIMWIID